MSRASEHPRLWLPQYWPTWAALGLFYLAGLLPWAERRVLARGLAAFAWHIVRLRRRVVLTNLRLCFPEKNDRERQALARAHYEALAYGLFETTAAWWSPSESLPPYRVVGRENYAAAVARGKGVVALTAHFTTLEMCGRLLTFDLQAGCLYRDPNNPVVAWAMRRHRERISTVAVHLDDLRGLLRALRARHVIWYAPDQAKRTKSSEILPFFGVPAITNTATSKIAEMTGAPVLPYFTRREADYSYTLTILPALENFPTADAAADAIRINRLIEEHIRRTPEQYFWVHKRFKARGPGYPEVY